MEKTLIASGKTIDLAVESALAQLGLDRDSVSVMVLQQAKAGFLGFGAQPAKVQVTYEAPDPVPEAPKATAHGTAGQLKTYDVEPKTCAMLMAIVADKMGKPLNELRFISIKEVK